MTETRTFWRPSPETVEAANATRLARALGCADYDALLARSLADPAGYWDVVNRFCGIRWRMPYEGYVDLLRGREFPVFFPGGRLNWTDTVFSHAEDDPDRMAVVSVAQSGRVVTATYGELREMARRFAGGLRENGIGRGDRVGLLMENGLAATVTFLAISHVGAIAVPLFSGFGSDAIEARLSACGAKALIASSGFDRRASFVSTFDTVAEVRARMGGELQLIIRMAENGPQDPWEGALGWHALQDAAPMEIAEEMASDDPYMIIFTSGTTGKPKGTVHTHGGFPIKVAHDSMLHFNVGRGSTYCWPADMGWSAGPLVLTCALMPGAKLVLYDGAPDFPDWGRLARLIEEQRITHFGSVPTVIRGLAVNMPVSTAADMSSIELLITAGESIAPEHFVWYQENIGPGNTPVINYTGGTEVSGALLSSVITKPIAAGTFNAPAPAVAVDIIDLAGNPLTGEVGELAMREPFLGMTRSFWGDDERYLETYWRTVPGIWVHGDLASRDAEGNYVLLGRSDDTIKIAGKRVGPAEVEDIVVEIPEVKEVAVVGVADALKGQTIVVFAATKTPSEALKATIRERIKERLGKPFSPSAVHLLADLPKTRSGKVMRRVIRSVYSGLPAGDMSSLANPDTLDEIRRHAPAAANG